MNPRYHTKLDNSDFLTGEDIAKYGMMVGSLNLIVTLGHYVIYYINITLACYTMIPKKGHTHTMCCVFGYL